jgi:uncharacterized membrane protein YfcA
MPGLESIPAWGIAWIVVVMLAAGFAHGIIGFGFPIIATPLLALVLDLKTAVLVILVPTVVVAGISSLRGGTLRESIGRYWFLPFVLIAGSYLGTRILIVSDTAPFILLLATILFTYLNLDRLGRTNVPVLRRHPVVTGIVFGFVAGLFEATVNVSGPMLLIYFLLLGVSPAALVQTLNFCFVGGKLAQGLAWSVSGGVPVAYWLYSLPWALLGVATLFFGERIRRRTSTTVYLGWLRKFLWAMVVLLVLQFLRMMWARM